MKSPVKIQKVAYKGWKNCLRLSNGLVEAIVTTAVGPRVIRFGFESGPNQFHEVPETLGKTGGNSFHSYGGHRFWHAPERSRTYYPDNGPVAFTVEKDRVTLVSPVEKITGIQKEIEFSLIPGRPQARVIHRLRNHNAWPVEMSPWAISVMAQGGKIVIPFPGASADRDDHGSTQIVGLWPYSNMADPRWTWGTRYLQLRQDVTRPASLKAGLNCVDGWEAYWNMGHLFVDKFTHQAGAHYPDNGCSAETYTDGQILEVESLGPLATVQPGKSVEHAEDWFLYKDVPSFVSDEDIDRFILPVVRQARI